MSDTKHNESNFFEDFMEDTFTSLKEGESRQAQMRQRFEERRKTFFKDFDKSFDDMDERIQKRKSLNGKATNHEIEL